MITWHWVRHGPTHARSFVGWRDIEADLSDTGCLERLRAHLPQEAVVVSSDLRRAVRTADALTHRGAKRLPNDPHLRELHFGHWEGLTFTEVADRDPELSRQYWEAPGAVAAPGGESWNDAAQRVASAVDRVSAQTTTQHIIAVAHFGVILTQVQRALGISAYEALAYPIDNLSVTCIEWHDHGTVVPHINLIL